MAMVMTVSEVDDRIAHEPAIRREAVADLTTYDGVEEFVVLAISGECDLITNGHIEANAATSIGIADTSKHIGRQ